MQIIPIRVHNILDYVVGAMLILVPYLLGFANGGPEQWVPQVVGVLTIVVSLITAYEISIAKLVPFNVHLILDVVMGIVLILSPWVLGFGERVWWPHVLAGIIYIVVPLLTRRSRDITV